MNSELCRLWNATTAADDEPDDAGEQSKTKGKASGRQTGERFALLNGFVDFAAGTLNRAELLVWLTLYRDTKDGTAATSQADIARRTGLCKRTVQLTLHRLAAAGLVRQVHRGGIRRGHSR